MNDDQKEAVLTIGGQSITFPTRSASLGHHVIEMKMLGNHGFYSFDPGFYSTASCESTITFIDGERGILLYRGYPIEQLAFQGDYMDVCFALLYSYLPKAKEKQQWMRRIHHAREIPPEMVALFQGLRHDAHPMAMMISLTGALSAYYPELSDVSDAAIREEAALHLLAKIPALTAMCYRHSLKQNPATPSPPPSLDYAASFLHMMFGHSDHDDPPHPVLARAIDRIFTLHADHEQNASTSTVRMAGSTGAHPFACIAAGMAALWGPAHGGANEACLKMLHEIGDESQIERYLVRAKDKDDPFRLMGFGHRVYKNYDPRAVVMQKTCHEVLKVTNSHDTPLFKLAMKLEKMALEDEYFIDRKLYPNVDFYSGIILSALKIPSNMFTVIFALARTIGWVSHWMEMMQDPHHTLARPRQLYTGPAQRDFIPIDER